MKKYELPTLYQKSPNIDVTCDIYDKLHDAGLSRTSHGMIHLEATLRQPIHYTDVEKHMILTGFPCDKRYHHYVKKDQITKATLTYINIEKKIEKLPLGTRPIHYFQNDVITAPLIENYHDQ